VAQPRVGMVGRRPTTGHFLKTNFFYAGHNKTLQVYIHSCLFLDTIKLYGQLDELVIMIYPLE